MRPITKEGGATLDNTRKTKKNEMRPCFRGRGQAEGSTACSNMQSCTFSLPTEAFPRTHPQTSTKKRNKGGSRVSRLGQKSELKKPRGTETKSVRSECKIKIEN